MNSKLLHPMTTPDPKQEMKHSPLPCPFCGSSPEVFPDDPNKEGAAWARVACVNPACQSQPEVFDGEDVADSRGSDAYKALAITRWNARVTSPIFAEMRDALEEMMRLYESKWSDEPWELRLARNVLAKIKEAE
jgi:hypothetical protein